MKNNSDFVKLSDVKSAGLRYIEIPVFSDFSDIVAGFTTRFGGVSEGDYATLNLNFNRPDPRENVLENFRRLSVDLGIPLENMVVSHQTHTKNVMHVSAAHAGMGITRDRSYTNIDGLLTSEKNLLLVTHYADCVPLYFYDSAKSVIALVHSGWRGTLMDIGGETVRELKRIYGSNAGDLIVAFGPHIRNCCFEVDRDVADAFKDKFIFAQEYMSHRSDGKWLIDLEGLISENLERQGVNSDNIYGCSICTKCNNDIFFSHRGSNGRTGTAAAFMMIKG